MSRPLGAWDDRQTRLLLAIIAYPQVSYRRLAALTCMSVGTAWLEVQALKAAGLVTYEPFKCGTLRARVSHVRSW